MRELGKLLCQRGRAVFRRALPILFSFFHRLEPGSNKVMPARQRAGMFPCSMQLDKPTRLFQSWQRLLRAADQGPRVFALA